MFRGQCPVLKKVYQWMVTFMQPKVYRAMQRAQGKMLREYFSGVPVENLSRRYGYTVPKIKQLASICRKSRGRTAQKLKDRYPEISLRDHLSIQQCSPSSKYQLHNPNWSARFISGTWQTMEKFLEDTSRSATASRRGEPFGRAPRSRSEL